MQTFNNDLKDIQQRLEIQNKQKYSVFFQAWIKLLKWQSKYAVQLVFKIFYKLKTNTHTKNELIISMRFTGDLMCRFVCVIHGMWLLEYYWSIVCFMCLKTYSGTFTLIHVDKPDFLVFSLNLQ